MGAELAVLTQIKGDVQKYSGRKLLKCNSNFADMDEVFEVNGIAFPYQYNNIIAKQLGTDTESTLSYAFSEVLFIGNFSVVVSYSSSFAPVRLFVTDMTTGVSIITALPTGSQAVGSIAVGLEVSTGQFVFAINVSATAIYTGGGIINSITGAFTNQLTLRTFAYASGAAGYLHWVKLPTAFVLSYKDGVDSLIYYLASNGTVRYSSGSTDTVSYNTQYNGYVIADTLYIGNLKNITAPTPTTLSVVAGTGTINTVRAVGYESNGDFYYATGTTLYKRTIAGVSSAVDTIRNRLAGQTVESSYSLDTSTFAGYVINNMLPIDNGYVSTVDASRYYYPEADTTIIDMVIGINPNNGMCFSIAKNKAGVTAGVLSSQWKGWVFKPTFHKTYIAAGSYVSGTIGNFILTENKTQKYSRVIYHGTTYELNSTFISEYIAVLAVPDGQLYNPTYTPIGLTAYGTTAYSAQILTDIQL